MSGYCYGKRIWKEASCWCYPSTWNWCYLWGHWSFRKCQRYSEGVSDASFAKTWTFQPRTTYEGRHSLYFKILASLSWQAFMDVFFNNASICFTTFSSCWIEFDNPILAKWGETDHGKHHCSILWRTSILVCIRWA